MALAAKAARTGFDEVLMSSARAVSKRLRC
jgi:hypothetical protein